LISIQKQIIYNFSFSLFFLFDLERNIEQKKMNHFNNSNIPWPMPPNHNNQNNSNALLNQLQIIQQQLFNQQQLQANNPACNKMNINYLVALQRHQQQHQQQQQQNQLKVPQNNEQCFNSSFTVNSLLSSHREEQPQITDKALINQQQLAALMFSQHLASAMNNYNRSNDHQTSAFQAPPPQKKQKLIYNQTDQNDFIAHQQQHQQQRQTPPNIGLGLNSSICSAISSPSSSSTSSSCSVSSTSFDQDYNLNKKSIKKSNNNKVAESFFTKIQHHLQSNQNLPFDNGIYSSLPYSSSNDSTKINESRHYSKRNQSELTILLYFLLLFIVLD
jgi:hypothetical protein